MDTAAKVRQVLEEAGHNCYFILSGEMKTEKLSDGKEKWEFDGGAIHSNDLAALHYAVVGWLRRHTEDGRFMVLVEPVREFVHEMEKRVWKAAGKKPESEH